LASGVGNQPVFSRDGTRVATIRAVRAGTHEAMAAGSCHVPNPASCAADLVITTIFGVAAVANQSPLAYGTSIQDWSPDGRWILATSPSGGSDADLWLIAVDGSAARRVGTTLGGPRVAAFAPPPLAPLWFVAIDVNGRGTLKTADLAGRVLNRSVTLAGPADMAQIDPSPDGSQLAAVVSGRLVLVRPDGTAHEVATPSQTVQSVAFSPDGRSMVVGLSDGTSWSSEIVSVDGVSPARQVAAGAPRTGCQWSPDGTEILCFDDATGLWIDGVAGGSSRQLPWSSTDIVLPPSWQRLSP
jgi:dipeptidyl aminopeptidase/acylaminoacyl peptidase